MTNAPYVQPRSDAGSTVFWARHSYLPENVCVCMTAKHVPEFRGKYKSRYGMVIDSWRKHPSRDIQFALCYRTADVTDEVWAELPWLRFDSPDEAKVKVIGFPGRDDEQNAVQQTEWVKALDDGAELKMGLARIRHGYSGAPVIYRGDVIGVASEIDGDHSWAVDLEEVRDWFLAAVFRELLAVRRWNWMPNAVETKHLHVSMAPPCCILDMAERPAPGPKDPTEFIALTSHVLRLPELGVWEIGFDVDGDPAMWRGRANSWTRFQTCGGDGPLRISNQDFPHGFTLSFDGWPWRGEEVRLIGVRAERVGG